MGGNAIKGVIPIKQEYVLNTANSIFSRFENYSMSLIGSAGKRLHGETSGDIDIAINENDISFDEFLGLYGEELNCVPMKGLNIISFPQRIKDFNNLFTQDLVQVDLMFVPNLHIAQYTFYSPTRSQSKYKGIYRNELIAAIAKNMETEVIKTAEDGTALRSFTLIKYYRYQWNLITGLQLIVKERVARKDGKGYTKKEIITEKNTCFKDRDEMIEFIFGNHIDSSQVYTLEQCVRIISNKRFKYYDKLEQILETAIGFYNTRKLSIPKEIGDLYENIKKVPSK